MIKSRFFCLRHITVMFLLCLFLFNACQNSSDNNDPANKPDNSNKPDNPSGNPTGNTWIEFKNLEEFPVTIYSDSARQVVFVEIPATGTKKVSAEPSPMGKAFYPTFLLIYTIETTSNVYVPYNGPSITAAILADKTNTVSIPKLESVATNSAYITLINNSSFSLTFNEGSLEKSPLGGGSSIINNGQNASYEITPKSVSSYSVLRNGSIPVTFPSDLSEFKAGIIYVLNYNGTTLTLTNQLPINTEITVPGNNLAMKLAWLQNNILSNKSYFIEITANENIPPQNLSYSGKSDITIIMNGSGTMRTINLSGNGSLFTIDTGVTLILDNNIILNGRSNNNRSLVYINNGGMLVMNAGVKITGNSSTSYDGGGVFIYRYSNPFTMNGGEISGNTAGGSGGGVYISNGIFTMNGGKISRNTSNNSSDSDNGGGGVYVNRDGIFNMKDGEILGNTAIRNGGGVHIYTDYLSHNGIFRMGGGVIYGNNAQADMKNTAASGSALYKWYSDSDPAQYGTFTGDTFYLSGYFTTAGSNQINTTIRVVNGNLLTE
jgi:hypothetical protein